LKEQTPFGRVTEGSFFILDLNPTPPYSTSGTYVCVKGDTMGKIFVEVTARHNTDGSIRPLSIKWEDGRVFEADRLIDVRQAASIKGGGLGIRYACKIMGKQVYLFDDEGKWFVEK